MSDEYFDLATEAFSLSLNTSQPNSPQSLVPSASSSLLDDAPSAVTTPHLSLSISFFAPNKLILAHLARDKLVPDIDQVRDGTQCDKTTMLRYPDDMNSPRVQFA
jgi:hypothetical protein